MGAAANSDVIAVLVKDHREVEQMFGQIEQLGPQDGEARGKLAEQVVTELVRHSVAEEAYLYPAARRFLPGGDKLVDEEIAEHAEAEETMKRLERTEFDDPAFASLLGQLMREIRHHVQEEEEQLFPQLAEHADQSELEELGRKVEAMKKVAPTRPHPSAPDTPPLNKLAAPGAGLIDRVRDALSGRGKEG